MVQVRLGTSFLRFLLYIGLAVGIPVFATTGWYVLNAIFVEVPDWILVLSVMFVTVMIIIVLVSGGKKVNPMRSVRELELIASREQYEYLYERSPVPYLTLNKSGHITSTNLAAIRLFKTTATELIGRDFMNQLIPEDEQDMVMMQSKLSTGISLTDIEAQIESSDGAMHWVMLSIFVYGKHDDRLVALVDITHQKNVDIAKSEFVALAAHQLRTPIAAIRWNVELLKGAAEAYDEEQTKYYSKIERNVMRMINLINDFLSVSKLETGTFATDVVDINVSEFFDSVIDEHNGMITQKQLEVVKQYQPADLIYKADTRLFHIIVNNLFSNAAKYTGEGGKLQLSYNVEGSVMTIVVADTGIGVPAPEVEKLFTKFYRATNARTHRAEGTGLGLYIVKQSVEMMGGTITVSSEENVGTTFVIKMPLQ